MMLFWIWLWKIVLIGGMLLFGLMAVGVTIGGIFDIQNLIKQLASARARREHSDE